MTGASVVGHGDDGDIGPHIDYTEDRTAAREQAREIMETTWLEPSRRRHLDPDGMGLAPGADLVYSSYPANFTSVDQDYVNYNVRITTSSYSNGCNAGATSTTQQVDNDILQNPKLMHVFSAGNSASDCGYGAGSGWGNITGGHKAGKNDAREHDLLRCDLQLLESRARFRWPDQARWAALG